MNSDIVNTKEEDKYSKAFFERSRIVEELILSKSYKKIVVAGPGTGKTFLFKKALKNKNNTLTLTFVNSLVEDLSLELFGISDVRTLHGFSRSFLSKKLNSSISIFPKLSDVIKEDAYYLIGELINFDEIFNERDDENKHLEFYRKRRKYYKYYGYTDIIFATVRYLEKDKKQVPSYELIVVDEFQDFNKLEVSLIEILSEKSPVLIAGDDDQALYEFKNASAHYIRERYGKDMPEYTPFTLPYCARCTKVIVDATNDLIYNAKQNGYLRERIEKPFIFFESIEKEKESLQYPKICYSQKFISQIPWYIEKCISEIASDLKSSFSVLIISPFNKQSSTLVKSLKSKGFQNIEYIEKQENQAISLFEGLKLLLSNLTDNLGWRIVARHLLEEQTFLDLLKQSENYEKEVNELLDKEIIANVKKYVKVLKNIRDNKPIDINDYNELLEKIQIEPYEITSKFIQEEINYSVQRMGSSAIRKIPIKATTIQSSKGLSADVVFITHFDDQYFIKDKDKKKISDQDICNFIVALTRTKKKAFLISSKNEVPTFLNWISKERIQFVR